MDIELTVPMPHAAIEWLLNPLYGMENFSLNVASDQVKVAGRAALDPTNNLCVNGILRETNNYTTENIMPKQNGDSLETACHMGCQP